MAELSFVQIQPLRVCLAFAGPSINNEHARDLRQLRKYYFLVIFSALNDTVFQKVAVSFVLIALRCLLVACAWWH